MWKLQLRIRLFLARFKTAKYLFLLAWHNQYNDNAIVQGTVDYFYDSPKARNMAMFDKWLNTAEHTTMEYHNHKITVVFEFKKDAK